jgi:hypothetical protein
MINLIDRSAERLGREALRTERSIARLEGILAHSAGLGLTKDKRSEAAEMLIFYKEVARGQWAIYQYARREQGGKSHEWPA